MGLRIEEIKKLFVAGGIVKRMDGGGGSYSATFEFHSDAFK
jgi:hypothetical protein